VGSKAAKVRSDHRGTRDGRGSEALPGLREFKGFVGSRAIGATRVGRVVKASKGFVDFKVSGDSREFKDRKVVSGRRDGRASPVSKVGRESRGFAVSKVGRVRKVGKGRRAGRGLPDRPWTCSGRWCSVGMPMPPASISARRMGLHPISPGLCSIGMPVLSASERLL
jgi:hypothetical protein